MMDRTYAASPPTTGPILRERVIDGITWRAQVSGDRGRLEVVAVIPASDEPRVLHLLTEPQLRELLGEASDEAFDQWRCAECGCVNSRGRRWCAACAGTETTA